ncbi:hypothetical protein HS7_16960 [Sulfolobales archaeon HS-7]|nr:hypothetical protein HS7_16960 [Sulfolobales archaeon HS-7]
MRVLLITKTLCNELMVQKVNRFNVDAVIGVGDVTCPERFKGFKGLHGELDGVHAYKYIMRNRFTSSLALSSDFTTEYVVSHMPPLGSTTAVVNGVYIGSIEVTELVKRHKPKILFHGHVEDQGKGLINGVLVVSIGSLDRGRAILFDEERLFFEFLEIK